MCGIIGLLTNNDCIDRAVSSLERLEYRGYDSSGIAVLEEKGFAVRRAKGKISALRALLKKRPLSGVAAIGHTRWATHGRPAEKNAHPMQAEDVCIVHNGIIDNFITLRDEVTSAGKTLASDTDTEVIAYLLQLAVEEGASPIDAIRQLSTRLQGAYAIAAFFSDSPGQIYFVRHGSPLAIGIDRDKGESFVGSDQIVLAPLVAEIGYIEDGDWGWISRNEYAVWDKDGKQVQRATVPVSRGDFLISKGNYRHFMHKEIHQQPTIAIDTLQKYVSTGDNDIVTSPVAVPWEKYREVLISGCGTAFYAGMVSRYWFEDLAGISTHCEISSELRYRSLAAHKDCLAIFISQSGETMDTLEAMRFCKRLGLSTLAICNVQHSTLDREADLSLHTCAGVEVSVASTKAYTAQVLLLYLLAIQAGRRRKHLDQQAYRKRLETLRTLPRCLAEAKQCEEHVAEIAREISGLQNALFIGRGLSYPLALEGALKLKEISYIHAEGMAAGELKHGSIALIDNDMPVVVVAPPDRLLAKTLSNVQEIAARGAKVILLSSAEACKQTADMTWRSIVMPDIDQEIAPLVYALPLHLLAYHVGVHKGTDVDQPRNLAKSVTVE